jgi:uncharacterized protein YbgA (DUF1722 family)
MSVEEEGRLNDPRLRENFSGRVFTYHSWPQPIKPRKSPRALVDFYTRHKLLLLAHSPSHCRRLGQIVADAKKTTIRLAYEHYGRLFMAALAVRATTKKHSNVFEHLIGHFSKHLSTEERREWVAWWLIFGSR